MVRHAGVEAGEGVTFTEILVEEFVVGFVVGFDDEVEAPLETGVVVDVGFAAKSVFVEAIALAAEPLPPPHPQPQSARAIRKTKSSKHSDL
jgi:hypothetical protein